MPEKHIHLPDGHPEVESIVNKLAHRTLNRANLLTKARKRRNQAKFGGNEAKIRGSSRQAVRKMLKMG